jgi:hypothetical protein
LFLVEAQAEGALPEPVRGTLHGHGLREASEVSGVDAPDAEFAGELADGHRYRFVGVRACNSGTSPSEPPGSTRGG